MHKQICKLEQSQLKKLLTKGEGVTFSEKCASPRQRGIKEGTNLVPLEKLCPFFPSKIKMRHHTEPTYLNILCSLCFPCCPCFLGNQMRHRSLKEPSSLNFVNHRQSLLWIGTDLGDF